LGERSFEALGFAALPEEVRLRLLIRAINAVGHEGPVELGKVEALLATLDRAIVDGAGESWARTARPHLKQTLADATVSPSKGGILIAPAPARRHRSGS